MGNKTQEEAETGEALPHSSLGTERGPCVPASACPPSPSPHPWSGQGKAQYLRMVCVIDVWRCSTGRRGSW